MISSFPLIANTVGTILAQNQARINQDRALKGLPPLPTMQPQPKTPTEINREKRDNAIGELCFWTFVVGLPCLIYATAFGALIFTAIKIAFAMQGYKFP